MSDIAGEVPPSTPVSVITGFLGSGKTTLLSRLLADPRMCKAAVIINEFGEVGLDHLLVTSPREDVTLLSSGCLCCSLRGDLINTLTQLFNERARGEIPDFDRVLVETTGLADPAPVLLTVSADERLSEVFHIERVITTVDAAHGIGQLDSQPESVKQACVADILLLTKTDVAAAGEVAALRARLNRLNPIAHTQDVVHGEIDPDWLFNIAAPGAPRLRDFGGLTGRWMRTQDTATIMHTIMMGMRTATSGRSRWSATEKSPLLAWKCGWVCWAKCAAPTCCALKGL